MVICPSCLTENYEGQKFCGNCGFSLVTRSAEEDVLILDAAYNYAPLIQIIKWEAIHVGTGLLLAFVGVFAYRNWSNLGLILGVIVLLWLILAIVLGVLHLLRLWQNAEVLAETHPQITKILKALFWWNVIGLWVANWFMQAVLKALSIITGPWIISLSVVSHFGMVLYLQWRRDQEITGRFPSNVTIWSWVLASMWLLVCAAALVALTTSA